MDTTQNKFTSIGDAIGDKANRQLDELIVRRSELADLGGKVMQVTKDCALVTDHYVRENTWKAVGMGAALGLILGLLLRRD